MTFGGKDCIEGVDYTVDNPNGKITRVNFHNIDIVYAKDAVEFTVTKSDSTEFTVKYSIVDYVLLALENGSAQSDLLIALQKYLDSVHEYLTFGVSWITPDIGNSETNSQGLPGISG